MNTQFKELSHNELTDIDAGGLGGAIVGFMGGTIVGCGVAIAAVIDCAKAGESIGTQVKVAAVAMGTGAVTGSVLGGVYIPL